MDLERYLAAARRQAKAADDLARTLVVASDQRVVNVHAYAWEAYEAFLRTFYADSRPRVVALSMNPGPFGAVQTGIPFCDATMARDYLPDFERLVRRKPAWLRSERNEVSALKLAQWSAARFGGLRELYRRILLAMTCPVAILQGPSRRNVPLPALPRSEQRKVEEFIARHAPDEIVAARPPGVLVLGDWALHTWRILQGSDNRLRRLPWSVGPHPAAHITNRKKLAAWSRSFDALPKSSL